MSVSNVDAVRRVYEGGGARLEPPRELFDRDYVLDTSDISPDTGAVRGYDAAQEVMLAYWEMFDDFHVELEDVVHADDKQVIIRVRDSGRVKGSDSEVWNLYFHVWTFAQGKVVRLSMHTDKQRALEAAGLQE